MPQRISWLRMIARRLNRPSRIRNSIAKVHGTSFAFNPVHGKEYHIYLNSIHNKNQMGLIGPKDWTGGKPPEHLTFVASAIKKGDSTWEYVDEDSVSN